MGDEAQSITRIRKPKSRHVLLLLFFLALASLLLWPLPLRLTEGLLTLPGIRLPDSDVSIFLWNFWWVKRSLLQLHSPVFCDMLRQPGPPAFVFPTLSLLNSLFAAALMSFTSAETAYNILVLVILALTGWSLYLLVNEMTGSWPAAVFAGVFFGTTAFQVRHVGQLSVFTLFWMPLALVAGRRLLATGNWKWAVLLGAAFVCNLLSDWYHAVDLAILIVLLTGITVWQNRPEPIRRFERTYWPVFAIWVLAYVVGGQFNIFVHFACLLLLAGYLLVILHTARHQTAMQRLVSRLVGGAVGIAALSLPIVLPMYRAVQKEEWLKETPLMAKSVFSADLASYLMPGQLVERLYPSKLPQTRNIYGARAHGPSDVFPGVVTYAILIAAVWWYVRHSRRGGGWLLLSGVFLILSLGPMLKLGGIVKWDLNPAKAVVLPAMAFEFLAILSGIRAFLRFLFTAYLCAGIFVGLQAADFLAARNGTGTRRQATVAMLIAGALMAGERLELPQPISRVPDIPAFQWLHDQPAGLVLLCPISRNQYQNLYSQTRHEKPMVNPYVSRRPEDVFEWVEGNRLLAFLDRPAFHARAVEAQPESLRVAWAELKAVESDGVSPPRPVRIVMSRFAYPADLQTRIATVLKKVLGLDVVFEDDFYAVFGEKTAD